MGASMTPFVCNALFDRINMKNEDDTLTNLPKDIKAHILSLLPTKDAVRTGLLSKKWEHMWKFVHSLKFDEKLRYHHKGNRTEFIDLVYNVLMVSECKTLTSFYLQCSDFLPARHVETWITTVTKRGVQNVTIKYGNGNLVLPRRFLRSETFRKLDLSGTMRFNVTPMVSMENLTELHLTQIRFRNEDPSLKEEIILNFPALKIFRMLFCKWHHVKAMKIYTNALLEFITSYSCYKCECCESIDCKIEMFASKKFVTRGDILENFIVKKAEVVREAEFGQYFDDDMGDNTALMKESSKRLVDILSKFTNVATLQLSADILEASTWVETPVKYPVLDKVTRLNIYTGKQKLTWQGPLMGFLKSVPNVKILNLKVYNEYWNEDVNQDTIFETPDCIVSSIRLVTFEYFGATQTEIELVKVFLKDGLALQEVSIVAALFNKPILEKELLSAPKASSEANIELNYIKERRKRKA